MGREAGYPVLGRPFASQTFLVAQFLEGLLLLKHLTTRHLWHLAIETKGDLRQCSSSRSQYKPRKDMAGLTCHCTSCEC
eukprot:5751374-Amphidinium_carterae.1